MSVLLRFRSNSLLQLMVLRRSLCTLSNSVFMGALTVAVVGIGNVGEGYVISEQLHKGRENIRLATSVATAALRDVGMQDVYVDMCGYPDGMAQHTMRGFPFPNFSFAYANDARYFRSALKLWDRGRILASGQNFVRRLSDMPSNLLTPARFAEQASEALENFRNVQVIVRDKQWITEKRMGALLAVAKGSHELPLFLEVHYKSSKCTKAPICLVGKGVCFDSGGISLKPSGSMADMRYDMSGAACVLGAIRTLAHLNAELSSDIVALMPLVENMPGGGAVKPGDVVFAMNGKSIQVENTDAEGRMILADALCYADSFGPAHVIDVATLTGETLIAAVVVARLWEKMFAAGGITGDRVWRMPLFKHYADCIHLDSVDLCNTAKPQFIRLAGSCTAAAFLHEFTNCKSWMHMDIAGVSASKGGKPLYNTAMTGRPLRTVVTCLESL
ncbi:cytosol aminopeptidase [Trichuris trichiura]|uniref:Cytosol aminopeptidase n=1 Tax=Trichuris trichiura TaxID=36087 RepID=A0A077Z7G6_TRITR|nr:cytosol aminopeptidase [Trichuris trichiura]